MELSEAIQKARSREPEGFQFIFQYSVDSVYFRAAMLLGTGGNPLVFIHDVYVSAFQRMKELSSPSDLRVWLGESLYSILLKQPDTGACEPPAIAYESEHIAVMIRHIAALPVQSRAVLLFSYYDGCSTGQIAQIIKQDETIVKRMLKVSRAAIEDGIAREKEVNVKVNAAALTFALCQCAKQKRMVATLLPEIFRKICVDIGLMSEEVAMPQKTVCINPVQLAEGEGELQKETVPEDAEPEKLLLTDSVNIGEQAKEEKKPKSLLGKLFHILKD